MNKKNLTILLSVLLLTSPVYTTDDSLPELMQRDAMLRPHVKSLISSSTMEQKTQLLSAVESSTTFRSLNFAELLVGVFNHNAWMPHVHTFTDRSLQELFHPYSPKLPLTDVHHIFLANVLYDAGSRLYDQTHNPHYLEHAASIGHSGAQYKMFFIDFDSCKLEAAKNYLLCSGDQGNLDALFTLSEALEGFKQIGLQKNPQLARLLCQEAANLGHPEATFTLIVATFTEGTYGSAMDFKQGIRNAKQLADRDNQPSKRFLEAIMKSSGDALQEGNKSITTQDLNFLRTFLGWKDEGEE
ncbi:MAG: sel1 repeat family protein [Alphaproteobacteria bacterium]|nr:sel1 repeat family protein [Alphaproteobacteria bacterium]